MATLKTELHQLDPTPKSESPLAVLIVDDDELIRLHLRLALSNEGLAINEASDASQALHLAANNHFDIILMDVRMPGLDGFSACEELKKLPGHLSTPVVMLTGMDDQESFRRASEVGAVDYMNKPLNTSVLAKRIRHIVQAQRNSLELDKQRASQDALLQVIQDGILHFDAEGILLASKFPDNSPGLLSRSSAIGSDICEVFSGVQALEPLKALRKALQGDSTAIQIVYPGQQQHIYEVRFVASSPNDVMCVLHDITQQVMQQRHIDKLSLADGQTGLPNYTCLLQVGQRKLDTHPTMPLFLLQLNFPQYPAIKNSVGSKLADKLIDVITHTLIKTAGVSQQQDLNQTARLPFLARSSDAEFHLLLADSDEHDVISSMLEDLQQAFAAPIRIAQYEFRMPLLVGVASAHKANGNIDELLKMCGLAAQKASQFDAPNSIFYSTELQQKSQRNLSLESCLRNAISQGELELLYQPKVCSLSGKIKGVEALSRWKHPQLGSISPIEFIALAEETGLILPLGELVLEQACKQSRIWQLAGYTDVPIAVNVSGHQFNQRMVDQQLLALLERMDVSPQAIELEITESVLVEQTHVRKLLERVRERGIRIAIDDFGTGHSSLSMLQVFPVDILKIDRAFISAIADSSRTYAIVDTIIALGHALNLTLVAEGVETDTQLYYLRERNCQLIQGYLTGRPMPAQAIEEQYLSAANVPDTSLRDSSLRKSSHALGKLPKP